MSEVSFDGTMHVRKSPAVMLALDVLGRKLVTESGEEGAKPINVDKETFRLCFNINTEVDSESYELIGDAMKVLNDNLVEGAVIREDWGVGMLVDNYYGTEEQVAEVKRKEIVDFIGANADKLNSADRVELAELLYGRDMDEGSRNIVVTHAPAGQSETWAVLNLGVLTIRLSEKERKSLASLLLRNEEVEQYGFSALDLQEIYENENMGRTISLSAALALRAELGKTEDDAVMRFLDFIRFELVRSADDEKGNGSGS